ncbi:oxidoreductase-like domain-containing protein [Solimonas terrae]|uniref:Oxidoreductase n=1 Tax=Solimonas terrae TaxID=1396819 RepID=A0A6M2BRB6_9GAMM|nr:oxidoreductase-like domain-containing protein [Solimonas terrae]NGY04751.1 oxidoreductase [Solimonas terrae]
MNSASGTTRDDDDLPPPPERPDCCFGGCAQCVLDDYAEQMQRWQAEVDAILERRKAAGPDR